MRIALITDYASTGGAAVAATRVATKLRQRGHVVGRIFCYPPAPGPDSADAVYALAGHALWLSRLSTVLRNRLWRVVSQARWSLVMGNALRDFRPDVINIHNLHGAGWGIPVVKECLRIAPVLWTMHDMWPITGTCVHSHECMLFKTACTRQCPQAGQYPVSPAGMIPGAHARRRELYNSHPDMTLVSPSQWLADHAIAMTRESVPVLTVSNGLDLARFRPIPKDQARALLRLPDDGKPTFLASAVSLADENKGMRVLIEALKKLKDPSIRLLLLGHDNGALQPPPGMDVVRLGTVSGEDFLAIVYSAADLFIHPSLAENQPLVIMEALACGVPVVAMRVGGIPEMVREDQTGWLSPEKTSASLAAALERALDGRGSWAACSARCRRQAEELYSGDLQVERYERIFEDLRARRAGGGGQQAAGAKTA